jgi:predicted transcriptional regulator of viral defense system
MHKDHLTIMHELQNYASPKARLTRMIKSGEVIQVRRGIFLNAKEKAHYSLKSLAAVIYGPSYISFEYALAHYGLIPERVQAVTSAAYNKNKNRRFSTALGDFYYYYLPTAVFPYGVVLGSENDQSYLIATPEKALCDTLYKTRGIGSRKALQALLLEDWRMEREALLSLDRATILFLAPLYRKKIFRLLLKWLGGEANNA